MIPTDSGWKEKFLARPCGTRSKYVVGCRCDKCRAANTRAYHERQARNRLLAASVPVVAADAGGICPGIDGKPCRFNTPLRKTSGRICAQCTGLLGWNGLVDPAEVIAHCKALSQKGVGYKAVADAASVARSVLGAVLRGHRKQIRNQSARRILAVDEGAIADGALISARKTKHLINAMLQESTKSALAAALGSKAKKPALAIAGRRKVRASTALKVARLHRYATGADQ